MVYYLIRFASWLAGRTPRPWRLRIAGSVTELIYWGWVSKRHVTIDNMAQILGTSPHDPRARRLARISWRNFGRYISDFISIPNTTREGRITRLGTLRRLRCGGHRGGESLPGASRRGDDCGPKDGPHVAGAAPR